MGIITRNVAVKGIATPSIIQGPTVVTGYVTGTSASSAQTRAGIGQSMYFDGTQTATINVATNAAFAVYPVTVEAWVYAAVDQESGVVGLQNPTTGQSSTYKNNGFYQLDRSAFTASQTGFANRWSINTWNHISFTLWSSSASTTVADRVIFFLNGSVTPNVGGGSITLLTSPNDYTATGETRLRLGMLQFSLSGANSPFNGYISEIRISNTARYGTNTGTSFTPNSATAFTFDGNTIAIYRAV